MRKGEEHQLLSELEDCPDLNTWEDDFCYSLAQQLELGNELTPKQFGQTN